MLYVDAKELREKGSIVLLQNGAIIEAINDATMSVLDDIENLKADPTAKRVITPKITLVSNQSRTQLGVECSVDMKLAPKKVMDMTLDLGKALDDEGRLIGYQLKEQSEEADGQQSMDGGEVKREVVTIPHKNDAIEAEFTEKANEADTSANADGDTETHVTDENASNEALDTSESVSYDWETGEVVDSQESSENEVDAKAPNFPEPDDNAFDF